MFCRLKKTSYICNDKQTDRGGFPGTKNKTNMDAATIYSGLHYDVSTINMNYKIKVSGFVNDRKLHTLVGVSGLINIIGLEMTNKLLDRAFRSKEDKQVCKLRRGLKVSFYCH